RRWAPPGRRTRIQYGPPVVVAVSLFRVRHHSRVIAVAIVAGEIFGIVVLVIIVIRGRIEESLLRAAIIVVGALVGRTDVVDTGVARQIAAGLIAPRPAVFDPAAMAPGIAECLMVAAAAHHRADAAGQ